MSSCVVVHVCGHVWRVESELWPDARVSRPRCHLLLHHDHRVESWGPQGSSWTVQLRLRATEWKEVCRWLMFSFRQKLNEFLLRLRCYNWLADRLMLLPVFSTKNSGRYLSLSEGFPNSWLVTIYVFNYLYVFITSWQHNFCHCSVVVARY